MADGFNRVQLLGNLGADPELKQISADNAVLRLRLATSESWMKDGQKQERTEWFTVSIWGNRGVGLNKILKKGDRIFVEGQFRTSTYEKDGEKRYSTEVVAKEVVLCGGGGAGAGTRDSANGASSGGSSRAGRAPHPEDFPADDGEIPF